MFQNCLLSPGSTSQLIKQNGVFCLGSHHEIWSVYKYTHKETHTNPLKEHFIWAGSTYQHGNLWGTVEHGQTQIMGRMLFWKADEVFLVYFFATVSGSIMKTMKLSLVKSVQQKFWSGRFSPKHLGGYCNSFIYYHFNTRSFPVSYSLSISLTSFNKFYLSLWRFALISDYA